MTRTLLRRLGVLVAVVSLLTGAAAAAPAQSVADDTDEAIGPPGGLPDPVPDFVSDILDTITRFVEGVLGGDPGEEVSDAAGGAQ